MASTRPIEADDADGGWRGDEIVPTAGADSTIARTDWPACRVTSPSTVPNSTENTECSVDVPQNLSVDPAHPAVPV